MYFSNKQLKIKKMKRELKYYLYLFRLVEQGRIDLYALSTLLEVDMETASDYYYCWINSKS